MLLWDKDHSKLVESKRVRCYTLRDNADGKVMLVGSFNNHEGFCFGVFDTRAKAVEFLFHKIYKEVEKSKATE